MFLVLLILNFIIAAGISYLIIKIFDKSITGIIKRIIPEDISTGWILYLKLAIYLVGISGGVNIFKLEENLNRDQLYFTFSTFILELYKTIFDTLRSISWLLLIFFFVSLIAYIFTKSIENKK
ncbi:MAG: hypothetical protein WC860_08205 [Candidatus Margulisiibacteriota bacterium]|jgi:hypothetical protein